MASHSDIFALAVLPPLRPSLDNESLLSIQAGRDEILERTIGDTEDFLPFSFLEKGHVVGRSVARVQVRERRAGGFKVLGHGTGFLVTDTLLMTNHHVLPDVETAKDAKIQFNYEMDIWNAEKDPDSWYLEPETLFVTSPKDELDMTLTAVKRRDGKKPGEDYNYLQLLDSPAKVKLGERVNLIQHPAGRRKEVIVYENTVTDFKQGGYIHYRADTLRGSSGSPVFNQQWELVALHHSGVLKRDEVTGDPIFEDGEYVFIANEGIRISDIVSYLQEVVIDPSQRALIEGFIL